MLLFYVDEHGDHSMATRDGSKYELKQGVSPWFILAAVGIRDSSRMPLAEALFEIKQRHFGEAATALPWGQTEIKGRHLSRLARSVRAGRAPNPVGYRAVNTVTKSDALVKDLGLIFSKYRPITFVVAVDKRRLLRRHPEVHPLGAAYAYLHQRVALTIEKLHTGESAMFIADQQEEHERFFRSGEMQRTRDHLSEGLRVKPNFSLVLDKPLWVDTDFSSWDREVIQLPDIAAFSAHECVSTGHPPAQTSHLWPQIRSTMALHWRTGTIESSGLAIYPKPKKYPLTE